MTEKITYISDDGEEFETEEECLAYEKTFTELSGYVGFNTHMVFQDLKTLGIENAFGHSYFVFITDMESAEESFRVITEQTGLECPNDILPGGIYQYDDDHDNWNDVVSAYINRTDEICKLLRAIDNTIPRDKAALLRETVQKISTKLEDAVFDMKEVGL